MFKYNHPKELIASTLRHKYLYDFNNISIRESIHYAEYNDVDDVILIHLMNNETIILKDEPFTVLNAEVPEVDWSHSNSVRGKVPEYGELMTVAEFYDAVESGLFTDYDGHGDLSNGTHVAYQYNSVKILASAIYSETVTHIVWYNN